MPKFTFKTEAEAQAFREGVEYVNDSAVEVQAIEPEGDEFVVLVVDRDESDTQD